MQRLDFGDTSVALGAEDTVVLAVPPWIAADLVPGLTVPTTFRAIVNAHFRVDAAARHGRPSLGVVDGLSEWLFAFPDRLSVTISGADRLLGEPREALAEAIWREVAGLTGLRAEPLPPWQIVKERRATFAATPENAARRPPARTAIPQPRPRRRLDGDRPAGHHRGRRALGLRRCRRLAGRPRFDARSRLGSAATAARSCSCQSSDRYPFRRKMF